MFRVKIEMDKGMGMGCCGPHGPMLGLMNPPQLETVDVSILSIDPNQVAGAVMRALCAAGYIETELENAFENIISKNRTNREFHARNLIERQQYKKRVEYVNRRYAKKSKESVVEEQKPAETANTGLEQEGV
jgi:hypothetical protein